jgi:hypothetical protein
MNDTVAISIIIQGRNLPIHRVITDFVMTKTAWKKAATTRSSQFTISCVMLTTIYTIFLIPIRSSPSRNVRRIASFPNWYLMWNMLLRCNPPAVKCKLIRTIKYNVRSDNKHLPDCMCHNVNWCSRMHKKNHRIKRVTWSLDFAWDKLFVVGQGNCH